MPLRGTLRYPVLMHELSFAQQILETVQREAAGFGGVRVTRVKLRADEYLALEPASLRFCLESISQDTIMAGAEIEIEEVAAPAGAERPLFGAGLVIEEIELDEQDG
ncbi:MAG TPA: hydrogenase maturation nickel metallochaperone HypA [Candidatus Hydrogenedentes bacterium]|nr:hydrogenase maturation nickel metallochaperone HypA [Candidatus Hydrogenedentota bacterium]